MVTSKSLADGGPQGCRKAVAQENKKRERAGQKWAVFYLLCSNQ